MSDFGNVKIMGDRVLVRNKDFNTALDSGIILNNAADEYQWQGEVLAVGDKVREVTVGDNVLFATHSIEGVTINGESLRIIQGKNLLGVLEG